MRRIMSVVAFAAVSLTAPAMAQTLTTGTGDGQMTVRVTGTGAFGSNVSGASDASYNPIGAIPAAGTTYESFLYLRTAAVGGTFSGARTNLNTITATTGSSSSTATSSVFNSGALLFNLTQSVQNLLDNTNTQTGSLLTQSYTITNTGNTALQLELTRYFDGDLQFNGSITDGGGRLMSGGREILFELDSATGASTGTTFVGIYNEGATAAGYQISSFSGLRSSLIAGTALNGTIAGDTNNDGFIDNGYDVTLGLAGVQTLGAGQSFTFTMGTIWGSGAPGQIVIPPSGVPEPATWAMLMLGFGAVGYAMRRRPKARVRFA